ncbi:hypothetical protein GP2143_09862 [marine gamma proteobacterium HTCC2143]|uniref:Uncharacterized protein n=1 Tax=marine gamma proteobacterium HTCC2143 TaxID=247633 RepID=A0YDK9_9GAMM|nr:hypothetical protein GP2143_09862 [marine gamma proteobacterium HTCC2143]
MRDNDLAVKKLTASAERKYFRRTVEDNKNVRKTLLLASCCRARVQLQRLYEQTKTAPEGAVILC